jgi:hypothetical protein
VKYIHRHFAKHFSSRIFLSIFAILLCFLFSLSAFAYPPSEGDKIAYLLNEIGSSNLVFIRNGNEYTAEEVKLHLQSKMEHEKNSIPTVEDFINLIGSEFSITGIYYYVRLADGTQVESTVWLRQKLAEMR